MSLNAEAFFGVEEDTNIDGIFAGQGPHRKALRARIFRLQNLLALARRFPSNRQAAAGRRFAARGNLNDVNGPRRWSLTLKEAVANLTLENRLLEKALTATGIVNRRGNKAV